jgi:hypothetical protein
MKTKKSNLFLFLFLFSLCSLFIMGFASASYHYETWNDSISGYDSSSIYENGIIKQWFSLGNSSYINYRYSYDGDNWTNPTTLTSTSGLVKSKVKKIGNLYYMFAINESKNNQSYYNRIYVFSSQNGTTWIPNCSGIEIIDSYYTYSVVQNSDFYYDSKNSVWVAFVQMGTGYPYNINVWTSNDLCMDWERIGNITSGITPNIIYRSSLNAYILYYGNTRIGNPPNWASSSLWGMYNTSYENLVLNSNFSTKSIYNTTGEFSIYYFNSPDVVIIDDGNANFSHKFYIYYSTDVNLAPDLSINGISYLYDVYERSFDVVNLELLYYSYELNETTNETEITESEFSLINTYSGLFPDSETLTSSQRLAYVFITLLLIDILLFVIIFFVLNAKKIVAYILLIFDIILFFYFITIGYIPIAILVITLLILLGVAFFKFKGGH